MASLPNNENILHLDNTVVNKLNISSSDGYRLLTCTESNIKYSTMNMIFTEDGEGSDYISHDLITQNSSKINVNSLNLNGLTLSGSYIINSGNHSKAYINDLNGDGNASPDWTYKSATVPNLGNSLSYNVYFPSIYGPSGMFTGGYGIGVSLSDMESCNIETNSNTVFFSDMDALRRGHTSCSDGITGFNAGGYSVLSSVDYYLFTVQADCIFWGNLTLGRYLLGSSTDQINVFFVGAYDLVNVIDYITISSQATALDWGDLVEGATTSSCYNKTYGVFCGGYSNDVNNQITTMQKLTMAIQGNSVIFGDLVLGGSFGAGGCSDGVRGVIGGGENPAATTTNYDMIQMFFLENDVTSIDFGTLSLKREYVGACSNGTTALFGGGFDEEGNIQVNIIDKITISVGGNATDYGDLTIENWFISACSGN